MKENRRVNAGFRSSEVPSYCDFEGLTISINSAGLCGWRIFVIFNFCKSGTDRSGWKAGFVVHSFEWTDDQLLLQAGNSQAALEINGLVCIGCLLQNRSVSFQPVDVRP